MFNVFYLFFVCLVYCLSFGSYFPFSMEINVCLNSLAHFLSSYRQINAASGGHLAKNLSTTLDNINLKYFWICLDFWFNFSVFNHILRFLVSKPCFLDSSTQNHAEPLWNYLKKSVLDPKRAKCDQQSGFRRLVSVAWGWWNPQGGSGATLEVHRQSQPLSYCIRTL